MNYHEAGFNGYLEGKDTIDIARELAVNSKRHEKELKEIITGWSEAFHLDRATNPRQQ